jgi:UV DNA damage endonuclease
MAPTVISLSGQGDSMVRYGYACISSFLEQKMGKSAPSTNRTMIRKTFDQKGVDYASELALQNCRDLLPILKTNLENGIFFFRLSSNLFPWASEYQISALKDFEEISLALKTAGEFARQNNMRVTSHPGPFNKLCSDSESVVLNTITDLKIHGEVFDLLGLPRTHDAKINIHLGGAYGEKEVAVARFIKNFSRLPDSVKSRMTVENDDKASLYSTKELVENLYPHTGIPIVHDQHHHLFCDGGVRQEEAMNLAASTWTNGIRPVIHYSESLSEERGDSKIKPQAHSDYIKKEILTYGLEVDVMIEAKMKDLALLNYLSLVKSTT